LQTCADAPVLYPSILDVISAAKRVGIIVADLGINFAIPAISHTTVPVII
jgi:hypothetical protein